MAYIDADKVLEELENNAPMNWTDSDAEIQEQRDYEAFKHLIESQPTADVILRADVEKIFEAIDKRIASLEYRANTPRKTVKVEELKAQCDWILHEVIPKTLAELKKKYIGEKI